MRAPDLADLSFGPKFSETAQCLLGWCQWIRSVQLVMVDVVSSEPDEAGFQMGSDMSGVTATFALGCWQVCRRC